MVRALLVAVQPFPERCPVTHSATRRGLCAAALSSGVVSVGLLLGAATATAAPAAPAVDPVAGEPSATPAAPPVPVVQEPVDTTDGLYGVQRGSLPALGTPDLSMIPVVGRLPGVEVVALPRAVAASAAPAPAAPDLGSPDVGVPGVAGSQLAPAVAQGNVQDGPRDSALAGLDTAALFADLVPVAGA